MDDKTCESCGHWQLVQAQYGTNLHMLGLANRFCSSCLYEEQIAQGLVTPIPVEERM